MQQAKYKIPKTFSDRKVSVKQAIKMLRRNGIKVNEDQAAVILDFLYRVARVYSNT